jgi:hypothetical protein
LGDGAKERLLSQLYRAIPGGNKVAFLQATRKALGLNSILEAEAYLDSLYGSIISADYES